MATKKTSPIGSVLAVVATIIVVYFVYRLFFGRKVAAATTSGYGGGSAAYGNPYAYGQAMSNTGSQGLLNQLFNMLKNLGRGGKSSPSGGFLPGNAATAKPAASQQQAFNAGAQWDASASSLVNVIQSAWNDNPSLGGTDLYSYTPDIASQSGLADYQIPYAPIDTSTTLPTLSYNAPSWDLGNTGGSSTDLGANGIDLASASGNGYADTTSYYGDYSLDPINALTN